jgi:hypothetical protein
MQRIYTNIKYESIHFNTNEICNNFIIYINNIINNSIHKNFYIEYICCDGYGCKIAFTDDINYSSIAKLINEFNVESPSTIDKSFITINDGFGAGIVLFEDSKYVVNKDTQTLYDCDICYKKVKNIITKCKICKHPFCVNCWDKLITQNCPFCRSDL